MKTQAVRPTEDQIEQAVRQYSDMLYKLCFLIVQNEADAFDAVQDTFVKLITSAPAFQDEEHKKAWLIRVATNISKNYSRFSRMHPHTDIDSLPFIGVSCREDYVLEAVFALPVKYRLPIHLHYYEGYSVKEIASMMKISQSAVLKRLERGREKLKNLWKE